MAKNSLRHSLPQLTNGDDEVSWRWGSSQVFSVNSMYTLINDGGLRCPYAKRVWQVEAPLKVRAFLWLICHNAVLTWDNLTKRGWYGPGRCCLCYHHDESITHLFWECEIAKICWHRASTRFRRPLPTSLESFWSSDDRIRTRGWDLWGAAICWEIWLERNSRIFRNSCISIPIILQRISDIFAWWAGARTSKKSRVTPAAPRREEPPDAGGPEPHDDGQGQVD